MLYEQAENGYLTIVRRLLLADYASFGTPRRNMIDAHECRNVCSPTGLEHMRADESWIDLCRQEAIAVVWPEVMSEELSG